MKKLLLLALMCLFIFVSCESISTPFVPDATTNPTFDWPKINLFSASPEEVLSGGSSLLSWSVENAAKVVISQGIGIVASHDSLEVSPLISTTYILTAASITEEQIVSATVTVTVVLPKVILTTVTIPSTPILDYYPDSEGNDVHSYYQGLFTFIVTEANGVGGTIQIKLHHHSQSVSPFFSTRELFGPFATFSYDINFRVSKVHLNPPYSFTTVNVVITGQDNNGGEIDIDRVFAVTLKN